MGFIAGLVFVGVFTVDCAAADRQPLSPSRSAKQALATLDSALKTETPEKCASRT